MAALVGGGGVVIGHAFGAIVEILGLDGRGDWEGGAVVRRGAAGSLGYTEGGDEYDALRRDRDDRVCAIGGDVSKVGQVLGAAAPLDGERRPGGQAMQRNDFVGGAGVDHLQHGVVLDRVLGRERHQRGIIGGCIDHLAAGDQVVG